MLTFLLLMQAGAVRAVATVDMVFYGTLNTPPACTINNGQEVDVDFGERVGVNKADGQNYLQTINYRITCEPGGGVMVMALLGPVSGFDKAALQTNITGLAIHILQDGQAIELNKPINIAMDNPPVLQAVAVKQMGTELKSGAFSVAATLLVDYL
ncbi:fimbrial protein [Serratia plymuthica]|uniref:fimbrial protein n=1 Tax=Serratia plymuthica TaxID=82996 RepID=UPI003DA20E9F